MKRPLSLPIQLPMFKAACLREVRELCVVLKSPENAKIQLIDDAKFSELKIKAALSYGQSSCFFASCNSTDSSEEPSMHSRFINAKVTPIAYPLVTTTVAASKRLSTPLIGLYSAVVGVIATFCIRFLLMGGGHFLLAGHTDVLPLIPVAQASMPMSLEFQSARFLSGSNSDTFKENTPYSAWAADATENGEMSCGKFQGPIAAVTSTRAIQDGSILDVMGAGGQFVCVKDSRGKAFHYAFSSTSGRSFYGTPPWLIESPNLGAMQVYFQGVLVRLPQTDNVRLRLIESGNV